MVKREFSGIVGRDNSSNIAHVRERISGSYFQSIRLIGGVRSDLHRGYNSDDILLLFRIREATGGGASPRLCFGKTKTASDCSEAVLLLQAYSLVQRKDGN